MYNCEIGEEKYASILSLIRTKILQYVINKKRKILGILKEVKIDKTYCARRKYNVGYIGTPVWVWGAVEYKTGYCYLQVVENRQVKTLIPIINREIKKIVVFDKWAAYNSIQGCFHDTVTHKYNFVDPLTKANTQLIENLWLHLKKIKHYCYGVKLDTLADHLKFFMFFRNYKDIDFSDFLMIILNKV
ncbi:hypothetical protein DMUE_1030 [Dictyocoela muelleri]|nr:hypothetical protein DMUE_1030 [Dictyocoela muelleri]